MCSQADFAHNDVPTERALVGHRPERHASRRKTRGARTDPAFTQPNFAAFEGMDELTIRMMFGDR